MGSALTEEAFVQKTNLRPLYCDLHCMGRAGRAARECQSQVARGRSWMDGLTAVLKTRPAGVGGLPPQYE
jgi:hypothetical protein